GTVSIELSPPPSDLEAEYETLFITDSLLFLHELISTFDEDVDQVLRLRVSRKAHLDLTGDLPSFLESTTHIRTDPAWRVLPIPPRLQKRHVDIGDLAPCNTKRFIEALQSPAQGIQVDFDDGNCPTYHNQIKGIHNVFKAVHNQFPNVPHIAQAPVLMLRPRAWNMMEHNMMVVEGKEVPGPLFDFGLLMFHCGKTLFENKSGPFFYLSKVESLMEARLWNKIFVWTQQKLDLPQGSIKVMVLIENVLAAFEMEEILFELRDHSVGLNCGIWDYSASFVNKFGHRQAFLLPDRSKYVNMEKRFLRSYMDLLVQTCHRRGALATGGMAALLLPKDQHSDFYRRVLATVTRVPSMPSSVRLKRSTGFPRGWDKKSIQTSSMGRLVRILTRAQHSTLLLPSKLRDLGLNTDGILDFLMGRPPHPLNTDTSPRAMCSAHSCTPCSRLLKLLEIKAGVDGFMVYDLSLIEPMQKLFKLQSEGDNQLHQLRNDVTVTPDDLLSIPLGGVTLYGLKHNIAVGVLFIHAWLSGKGHFFYRGQVEDSATAEISRSQVWQWIRHQTQLEDHSRVVNRRLLTELTTEIMMELSTLHHSF
ncbi:hypothetical protein L3Q82_020985, partial [Scortum barcoo]